MNRTRLKKYAPQARRQFIKAVTDRAAFYGLTKKKIEPVTEQGDVAVIGGKAFPKSVAAKRKLLEQRIARQGFDQVMEAMAYTWFNRFVAIRYMELHGYLDHGYRVLSGKTTTDFTDRTDKKEADCRNSPSVSSVPSVVQTVQTPEIIEHAEHVDLPGLKKEEVIGKVVKSEDIPAASKHVSCHPCTQVGFGARTRGVKSGSMTDIMSGAA